MFLRLLIFIFFCSKVSFFFCRTSSNKAYPLKLGSDILPVYCQLTSLGACGVGGWTLVMKTNGSKVNEFRTLGFAVFR